MRGGNISAISKQLRESVEAHKKVMCVCKARGHLKSLLRRDRLKLAALGPWNRELLEFGGAGCFLLVKGGPHGRTGSLWTLSKRTAWREKVELASPMGVTYQIL